MCPNPRTLGIGGRPVRYAGVEAGGTTWVVAIAEGDPTNIVERADFPTSKVPAVVLEQVVAWLKTRDFDCLGVGSFGPIDLHRTTSAKFGYITTTPKPGWRAAQTRSARDATVTSFFAAARRPSPDAPH